MLFEEANRWNREAGIWKEWEEYVGEKDAKHAYWTLQELEIGEGNF
jgi:hypothetical protein